MSDTRDTLELIWFCVMRVVVIGLMITVGLVALKALYDGQYDRAVLYEVLFLLLSDR